MTCDANDARDPNPPGLLVGETELPGHLKPASSSRVLEESAEECRNSETQKQVETSYNKERSGALGSGSGKDSEGFQ